MGKFRGSKGFMSIYRDMSLVENPLHGISDAILGAEVIIMVTVTW